MSLTPTVSFSQWLTPLTKQEIQNSCTLLHSFWRYTQGVIKKRDLINLFALHFNKNLIYKGNHLKKNDYSDGCSTGELASNGVLSNVSFKSQFDSAVHTESVFSFHCTAFPLFFYVNALGWCAALLQNSVQDTVFHKCGALVKISFYKMYISENNFYKSLCVFLFHYIFKCKICICEQALRAGSDSGLYTPWFFKGVIGCPKLVWFFRVFMKCLQHT